METPRKNDFSTKKEQKYSVRSACASQGIAVSRLSQNASESAPQDTTLVVQVNDGEYRALAQHAQRCGCSVEALVAQSIQALL